MSSAPTRATIDGLIRLGVKRPARFDEIESAFKAATNFDSQRAEALQDMRDAIAAGDRAKAASARNRAVAAQAARADGDIFLTADAARSEAMRAAFDVKAAYRTIASKYDEVAGAFTDALGKCDPDASAEAYLKRRDHKAADAWASIPDLVRDLERYSDGLMQAARLARVVVDLRDLRTTLPLFADAPEAVREAVLAAWTPARDDHGKVIPFGRAGRFGAIVAAGAKLQARPLDKHERWSEPTPPPAPRMRDNRVLARAMR